MNFPLLYDAYIREFGKVAAYYVVHTSTTSQLRL
jgi:hypothetical protein